MKLDLNGGLLLLSSLLSFTQLSLVGKEMGSVVMYIRSVQWLRVVKIFLPSLSSHLKELLFI